MILKELAQIILDTKDIRTKTKKNYTGALARNIYPAYGNRPVISLSKFEFAYRKDNEESEDQVNKLIRKD